MNRVDIGKTDETSHLDEDEVLRIMKMRIIDSYRWRQDIIEPISKELGISEEELEEILIKRLDMASLEALHLVMNHQNITVSRRNSTLI